MKGLILYYSNTGNTKLACEYIARKVQNINFELYNIVNAEVPDLEPYTLVGMATFTNFLTVSSIVKDFIDKIPPQNGKYAFVFNSYGNLSGKTLKVLGDLLSNRGFRITAGHSLHMPESFPPLVAMGIASKGSPNGRELNAFKKFIGELDKIALGLKEGREIPLAEIKISWWSRLIPQLPRDLPRRWMGRKYVNMSLCIECGRCKKVCPYGAISLEPKPVFDEEKCEGCWACFNQCPTRAIYTNNCKGKGHYPKPSVVLQEKFKS